MNTLPKVKFCEAFKKGFKNGCQFSGRSRRSEYWFFFLFINLISLFLLSLTMIIIVFILIEEGDKEALLNLLAAMSFFDCLYGAIVMIPFLASAVRRLHDTGRSGYYFFISFIPLYGMVAIIYYLCLDSEPKENQFGPSTKYICLDFQNSELKESFN